MIYGLYKFLNGQMFLSLGPRIKNITLITILIGYYIITKDINDYWVIGLCSIGLIIIYNGVLNKPYLYVWNAITILINKNFFKKSIFIYHYDQKLRFKKKKEYWLSTDNPIGIIIENVVYIDDYYEKSVKILFFPNVNYMKNFNKFITQLDNIDTLEIIKRKMILHSL